MRFVQTRLFDSHQLSALPRSTALIYPQPSQRHLRQSHSGESHPEESHPLDSQPQQQQLGERSLRRIRSILEMVGVGVTMAAFMAAAMF